MRPLTTFLILLLNLALLIRCTGNNTSAGPQNQQVQTEKTKIVYLVRHAEKSNNDPSNPDLSEAGKARAEALKELLRQQKITAIYSTDYKRSRQTAQPLAETMNLTVNFYDPNDLTALAEKILKDEKHQKILIVGHSNTVLETIEALKAVRPVPILSDSDYDYLFKVTIPENGATKTEVQHYGN